VLQADSAPTASSMAAQPMRSVFTVSPPRRQCRAACAAHAGWRRQGDPSRRARGL